MKIPRIAKAIGNIDDDLIANAENNSKPKNKLVWVKWASLAACLVIFVLAMLVPTDEPVSRDTIRRLCGERTH